MNKTILQGALLTLFLMVFWGFFSSTNAQNSIENYDPHIGIEQTTNSFQLGEFTYELNGPNIYRNMVEADGFLSESPDDGVLRFDMNADGGLMSITISRADGSTFDLKRFAYDILSGDQSGNNPGMLTSDQGGSVQISDADSFTTDIVDVSGNSQFSGITSFTISGENIMFDIDDLEYSEVAPASSPTVTTESPSNVSTNSAILGGNVTNDGGATVTERGIVYSTSADPTTADNKVEMGNDTGSFSQNVTGLDPETTYYVRAYAINSEDTAYGNNLEFSTLSIFAGGAGTEADPYQIETTEQLDAVRDYLDSHFIQIADIDLGVSPWNEGEGWEPIGSEDDRFEGTLNGNGHTISNLFIDRNTENVGFFSYIGEGGQVSNIRIKNANITSSEVRVGILAGYLDGDVSKIEVSGTVSANARVGALAGAAELNSTITEVSADITITSTNERAGGLLGSNRGDISHSYAHGSVTGSARVGGLVGNNHSGTVNNNYVAVELTGDGWTRGLVGDRAGGTYTDNFVDEDVANTTNSGGGTFRSTEEMTTYKTFTDAGWNFDTIWGFNHEENASYPFLKFQDQFTHSPRENADLASLSVTGDIDDITFDANTTNYELKVRNEVTSVEVSFSFQDGNSGDSESPQTIDLTNGTGSFSVEVTAEDQDITKIYTIAISPYFESGAGTEADPYEVATAEQLDAVRNHLDRHFIQISDIDLGVSPWNDDEGWEPIGSSSEYFNGSFDGQGYKIKNLFIDRSEESYLGLFGETDWGSHLKNIGVVNADVTGRNHIGIIAGSLRGVVQQSYSTGSVHGDDNTGGLIGYSQWSSKISNSYSTADVTVDSNTGGGLTGVFQGDLIENSYASGAITGAGSNKGGLVGSYEENNPNYPGVIENSFYDKETSGMNDERGTPLSSSEMKTISTFTDVDWDFDTVWQIEEPQSGSISYPYLQRNSQDPAPGLIDTPTTKPIVTTEAPSSITPISATLGGNVDDDGGAAVTERGIMWSTSEDFDPGEGYVVQMGNDLGEFSDIVELLPFGTTIYYRAFAENSLGISYGDEKSFTTDETVTAELEGVEGWRMLSVPAQISLEVFLAPIWTQGVTTGGDTEFGEPNVYTWDYTSTYQGYGDSSTEGWQEVTDLTNTTLSAGQGVLVKVFEDDDYQTPGVLGEFPKSLPVTGSEFLFANPDMNTNEDGWTLLGNPFAVPMSWDQITLDGIKDAIYVWDPNNDDGDGGQPDDQNSGSWKTYSGGMGDLDENIAPFQGFFVQTDGAATPTVSFTQKHKATVTPRFRKQSKNDPIVRLQMSGQGMSNSAWLRFSPHGQSEETAGDALQLTPLSTNYALLATQKNDQLFDIGHFPFGEDVEIPLVTEATKTGVYTLQVTNFDGGMELYLNDRQTGESLRLEENSSYEFTLNHTAKFPADPFFSLSEKLQKTGVNEHRFTITTSPKTVEKDSDLPNSITLNQNYPNPFNPTTTISYELPETNRVQLNVYDLTGRQIATLVDGQITAGTHRVNFDASNLSSGVYIYRLTAGEKQFTRRLTLVK